jgi:predicted TPR repeat methyltransferase
LLERYEPAETDRVLEFGCGTGPLLARIEDDYDTVLGVDVNESMLELAREKVTSATVRRADFTEWTASEPFDVAVLLGGLLHVTADEDRRALARNAFESLREGGAFVTFFQPFGDDVENGSRDAQTVESERYTVERRSISALTSPEGHYTTTYLFTLTDEDADREAKMGTVFHGRFHDPEELVATFEAVGFGDVEVVDGEGPTVLRAVK